MGWREGEGTARGGLYVPGTGADSHKTIVVQVGQRDNAMEKIELKLDRFGLGYKGSLRGKHGELGSLFDKSSYGSSRLHMSGINSTSASMSFGLGVLDDDGDDGGLMRMAGGNSADRSQFVTSVE